MGLMFLAATELRAVTIAAAIPMASTPSSGVDEWAAFPCIFTVQPSEKAVRYPLPITSFPWVQGNTWSPIQASGFSSRSPCSIILLPPPPLSSPGWNTSFTRPLKQSFISFKILATVKRFAVWTSCPQACMIFSRSERNSRSFSSWIGRASMSARSIRSFPGRPLSIWAMIPGSTGLFSQGMERASSSRHTRAAVRNSWKDSSGFLWISLLFFSVYASYSSERRINRFMLWFSMLLPPLKSYWRTQ